MFVKKTSPERIFEIRDDAIGAVVSEQDWVARPKKAKEWGQGVGKDSPQHPHRAHQFLFFQEIKSMFLRANFF
jgi:hypothetical protein